MEGKREGVRASVQREGSDACKERERERERERESSS